MRKVSAICSLTGTNFMPSKLEKLSSLRLTDKQEPGSVDSSGLRKGKLVPKGRAMLECAYSEEERAKGKSELSELLRLIIDNYAHIKASGVEDIAVTLVVGRNEGNAGWYLEYEELKKVADLEIGLSIAWYEIEDDDATE